MIEMRLSCASSRSDLILKFEYSGEKKGWSYIKDDIFSVSPIKRNNIMKLKRDPLF